MNVQLTKATLPVERLVAQLITRLKPTRVVTAKPTPNRFSSVAIELDSYSCQVGLVCLHMLIKRDLRDSVDFLPLQMPSEISVEELFKLKEFLPGSDTQVSFDTTPLVLTHEQYVLLSRYVTKELTWLSERQTSRLFNVPVAVLDQCLMAIHKALAGRTKLLNWTELCNRSSSNG